VSTVKATELREKLSDTLGRVTYGGERVTVIRSGKPVAALVPIDDLAALEALEDREDLRAALEAIRRAEADGEKPIRWDEARKRLS
jgi:prevent-host-death family protein